MFWQPWKRPSISVDGRGAPVHISHFKSMQIPNWGRIREAAAMIEKARAEGLAITADQYPYTANSFSLANATLPDSRVRWSRADLAKRMESEPEFAAEVRRVIADELARTEKIEIAASKKFPDYVGKSLKEIAGRREDRPGRPGAQDPCPGVAADRQSFHVGRGRTLGDDAAVGSDRF